MTKIEIYEKKIFCTLFILIPLLILILFVFRIDDNQILIGDLNAKEYPIINKEQILNGEYQTQWGEWFSENFPLKKTLTKTFNQWKYSVFNELSGDWIVGKDHYLFSKSQSSDFCKGSNNFTYQQYDAYASKIAKVQENLIKEGKAFAYLINPVKAQIYYDFLPTQYQYIGNKYSEASNSDYKMLVDALKRHNVIYYDTTEDLKLLRETSNYPVFYKTGQHWNVYSCALAMNKFFDFLETEYMLDLPKIKIDSINENSLDPIDQDIYSLANLWNGYKEEMYFTTNRSYENKSNKCLFLFGTSFGEEIFTSLNVDGNNAAFEKMVYYEYLTRRIENSNGNMQGYMNMSQDTDISDLSLLNDVMESDIIIIEENSVLGIMEPHEKMINYLYKNLVESNVSLGEQNLVNDKSKNMVKSGWHAYEEWGRWSKDKNCSVEFRLGYIPTSDLLLDAELVTYGLNRTVNVYINGNYLEQIDVIPQNKHYYITIPAIYLTKEAIEIEFESLDELITPDSVPDTSWKIGLGAISFKLSEKMED